MRHKFTLAVWWIILTFALVPNAFSAPDPNFYIFLCFGQSNMEGQGPIEAQDQTVNARFQLMQAVTCTNQPANAWRTATPPIARCNTKIGPSDYFGREMVANLPANIKIGIVHVSIAGSKIEIFDKANYQAYLNGLATSDQYIKDIATQYGGNPYAKLVALAKLAQADGVIKGILLHQGESNTGDQAWPTKVKGVYTNLLTDLGLTANNVPLLAGEVLNAAAGGLCASMNSIIDNLPATIPTAHVISSSSLVGQSDNLHFTTASYRTLGQRYAQTMLTLLPAATANTAPTVTLTAPTTTSFTAPASITITATATDADGTVSSVKFYNGSTLLSTVTASPYTYTWTSVAAGTYSITAVATDNSAATTTSTAKSVTVTGTTTTSTVIGKCKGKYFGNIIPGSVPGTYTTYWNQVTSENGSKWGSVESSQGNYNFATSDVSYNWAKNNGGLFKYHNFVWGSQTPGYIATASTATITAAVENYIKACSTHYASMGGLKMIDVLNEPVNTAMPGNLKAALTAGYQADPANAADKNNQYGWAIWPYQLARKYFPNAVLLINEYNVEMNWNSCRAPYLAIANAIKNAPNLTDGKKNLIDGVGLQCHGIDNLTAANFKACIDEIWSTTGLPTHITEFDQEANPNEAKQTAVFSALIPVAWEHPHVAGITLWGYIQGTTWRNGNGTAGASGTDSGIMYSNGTPRPAMTWLINYMAGKPSLSCCPAPAPFGSCTGTNIPPTVSITLPANNATYAVGASVIINATAADADGTVASVKFYNGATLLGTSTTSPYSYTWTNTVQGNYVITAVATDNSGDVTTSTDVNITVGNPTTQVISNGEFDNGTTGWAIQNNGGATGTMSVVTNGNLSGINSLRICPSTTPGTLEWHVQVSQVAPIVTGKTYQISVMAKADAARPMSVAIQELASPYTTYFAQTVNLTTTAQTFTFTYTSTVTDAAAQLKFYVGADPNCVNIDKVSMGESNFQLSAAITAATATTFCSGGSVVLNANTGSGFTYQWNKDATAISSATNASYTATTAGSYTVAITANSQTVTSAATVVTVNAAPNAPTVTTPVTYCQNATAAQLTATGTALKWYADNTTTTALATAPTPVTTATGTTNYYVSQTTTGCESTRALIAVTVNALPTAAITASGATTFCTGGSVTLTASTGSSYIWKNGTTQVGTAATYAATAAGSYTVEVTNANNCKATSAATTVTVNAAPNAPTVTTPVTYCQNATATQLTATGTALKWYADNTTTTALATAPTPATTATGTTNYYVSQTTTGCESTRALIAVTVNATPTAAITAGGTTTFCAGGSVALTASTGSSYIWKNGATQVGTAVTYTATTAGSYTVEVTNASGCKATSAATVVTISTVASAPTVTSPVIYCQNASAVQLTATGTALKWYADNTTTTALANAPTPSTATVGTTNYYVSQTSGCESSRAVIAVTVNATPTAAITAGGTTTFCQGGSVTLTSSAGSSYKWMNGITQVGTSASYSATAAGSYTVEVTNASGCKATSAATTVTVNDLPTAIITASSGTTFCAGGSVIFTASTGSSYIWKNGSDQIGTSASYTAITAGSYTVEVTNAAGCKATSAATVVTVSTVASLPTVTSPVTYCQNATATQLTATGTALKWYADNTTTTALATAPTPSTATIGTTNYYVSQTNGCESSRAVIAVTVNAPPSAPTVTTPVTYCQNATATQLTAIGSSLKWYADNTTTTVIPNTPVPSTTAVGTTSYYVSQTVGCESARTLIEVTINAAPTAVITPAGPTAILPGGSVVLNANTGTGFSYIWFKGSAQVGTAASYTATTVGAYTVEVTNGSGCKATSAAIDVSSAANQPSMITITSPTTNATIDGAIIITASVTDADGSIALVEYLDGNTVIGTSTSAPYSYTWNNPSTGNHVITVRVTDSNGGITTSAPVSITSSSTSTGVSYSNSITGSVYPNPTSGDVYIESDMDLSTASFTIVDILGNEHKLSPVVGGNITRVDVSSLADGAYVIIIKQGDSILRKKFTVIK